MDCALLPRWLFTIPCKPRLPCIASLWTTKGQRLPERFEIDLSVVQGLHLSSKTVRRNFFHAQHEFSESRSNDFIAVLPQLVEEPAGVGRVEFNVFSKVRHQISANDGQWVVR